MIAMAPIAPDLVQPARLVEQPGSLRSQQVIVIASLASTADAPQYLRNC